MAGQKRKYGPYNDEYIELGRMPKEQRRPLPSGSRRHQEKVGKSQNSVSTVSRRGKEMENTKDRNLFDALQQADNNRKSQKTQPEDVPSRNPLTEILNERNQDGLISDEDLSELLKIHDPLTGLQLLVEENPMTSENQLTTPHFSPLPPPVSPLPPSPAPPTQSSIVEAAGKQNRIRRALGDDDFISFFDVRPIIIAPLDEEESALALLDEEENALLDEEGNENGKEDHEGPVCAEMLPGSITSNSRGSIEEPILIEEEDDGNVHLELNIMVRTEPIKKRTSPPAQVRASPPAPQLAPIATPSTLPSPYAPPNIAVSPPPGAGVAQQPAGTSQVPVPSQRQMHYQPDQQQQRTYREVHQVSQQYQAPEPQMNPFATQMHQMPTRYSIECPPSGVQGMVNVVSRFAPTTSYYPVGPENGMVGGRPVYSGAAPQMMMSHSHNAPGGGTVPAVPQSRVARHSHYSVSAAPQQVQVNSQYYAAPKQQPQRAPPISAAQWQDMMSRLNEKEKDVFLANLPEVLNRIHMRSRNVA